MRTIAIVLGDNDFGNMFVPLLKSLKPLLVYRDNNISIEELDILIRAAMPYFYLAYQVCGDFSGRGELDKTMQYLSKIRVFTDDAAIDHISNNDHDHGSWFLDVNSGKVEAY